LIFDEITENTFSWTSDRTMRW